MEKKFISQSPFQTKKLAAILVKEILKTKTRGNAFVLGLEGDLGGGKTTFLQGFAKGLGTKQRTTSPTFVILKKYKIQNKRYKIQNFYHIDCYRTQKPKEILDLGFRNIISNPQNIVAIEWADRIKKIMPKNTIRVNFKFINKNERKITINHY